MPDKKSLVILSEVEGRAVAKLKSARKWVPRVWIFRPGKATNPNQAAVILSEGRAAAKVEGPACRGAHQPQNFRAPSFRRFFPKGWETNTINFWIKTTQALLLAVAVCFSVGATDASSRFNDLGHRLMCTCSCAQLLGECNHVGCPESGHMRDELSAAIASGATDEQILTSFAAKYGATVLAAPTTHGFDLVAWIAPFAVFAAALLGTILLVRHWSVGRTQPAELSNPTMDALREKIRRETGSGIDGGI
ncbi:MAG: cytochrome c-type biogenesis protein CcmH [Terracidiphilus sp.]|jgi:cytochrome c-type biogenesis protein CcmH/NrfF